MKMTNIGIASTVLVGLICFFSCSPKTEHSSNTSSAPKSSPENANEAQPQFATWVGKPVDPKTRAEINFEVDGNKQVVRNVQIRVTLVSGGSASITMVNFEGEFKVQNGDFTAVGSESKLAGKFVDQTHASGEMSINVTAPGAEKSQTFMGKWTAQPEAKAK